MTYYRLYYLHGPRNEVERFEEFEVGSDAEAIARCEADRGLNPMELWSGHRKVQRWEISTCGEELTPHRGQERLDE